MLTTNFKDQISQRKIRYVLAQFVDIHGVPKAKAIPVAHLNGIFAGGAGFAAFAVDGLGLPPNGPDFMAVGDPMTFRLMPWLPGFARIACSGEVNGRPHDCDSRTACQRALATLRKETGLEFYSGLEPEFFLLRRDPQTGQLGPATASDTLRKPCYDYRSLSRMADFLTELTDSLIQAGIDVFQVDHEDANGQFEVNFTFSDGLTTADDFIFFKMASSEIARKHDMICSFMPKPFSDRPGSGMHMHLSLGKDGENAFEAPSDPNGLGLSPLAYQFLGGLLAHAQALTAIACPSANSYKRLVGNGSISGATWAPTHVAYGDNNRTAMVRVPYGRLELRVPDSGCNPYLLTAAVVAAGLDGIRNNLEPGLPRNVNLYTLSPEERRNAGITSLPGNLREAVAALENDPVIREGLGEALAREFIALKTQEWHDYHLDVSAWETRRYLEFF